MPKRECERCKSTSPTVRLYVRVSKGKRRSWKGVGWWCRICGHVKFDEKVQTSGKLEIVEGDIRLDTPTGELLRHIVAREGLSRQHIITKLEQGRELAILRGCELVEIFNDVVLPTIRARELVKS